MRHCASLSGLTFAIEEGSVQPVIFFIADLCAGIPELLCVRLVGNVFQHAHDFSIFNFKEQYSAELKIVSLLIDREGAVFYNVDSLFYSTDHLFWRQRIFSRS